MLRLLLAITFILSNSLQAFSWNNPPSHVNTFAFKATQCITAAVTAKIARIGFRWIANRLHLADHYQKLNSTKGFVDPEHIFYCLVGGLSWLSINSAAFNTSLEISDAIFPGQNKDIAFPLTGHIVGYLW